MGMSGTATRQKARVLWKLGKVTAVSGTQSEMGNSRCGQELWSHVMDEYAGAESVLFVLASLWNDFISSKSQTEADSRSYLGHLGSHQGHD